MSDTMTLHLLGDLGRADSAHLLARFLLDDVLYAEMSGVLVQLQLQFI